MKVFLLALGCGLVGFIEAPRLFRNKNYKDLTVFTFLLLFSFTIALLYMQGVELPNPANGIHLIVEKMIKVRFSYQG